MGEPTEQLPGTVWSPGDPIADEEQRWEVVDSARAYDGWLKVRDDRVRGPDGDEFSRVVVEHMGAVGVVAVDDHDRVVLLRQYRHAVGRRLLEFPAGVLDVAGEPPLETAKRELAEEAGLAAEHWDLLVQMYASPGMTDEHWHVYVATGLSAADTSDLPPPRHEEAFIEVVRIPVDEAVAAVRDGRMQSPMAVAGLLALHARRT